MTNAQIVEKLQKNIAGIENGLVTFKVNQFEGAHDFIGNIIELVIKTEKTLDPLLDGDRILDIASGIVAGLLISGVIFTKEE